MADKKISALTAATTPLAGTEVLPIVQSGTTVKVSVANLTAGRSTFVSELISDDGVQGRWTLTQDASGNGLFSSTPGFSGWRSARLQANGTGPNMTWGADGNTTVGVGNLVLGTAGKGVTTSGATALGLGVNGAVDAVTIDASKNLLVGTASVGGKVSVLAISGVGQFIKVAEVNATIMEFRNAQDVGGSITIAAGGGTSYNSPSDERLKHDIVDAPDASDLIDAIKVRSFKWKVDDSEQRYGMIAQELLEVAPEAVSQLGGSDPMLGVDYSKLVPMLVKELQSVRARLAQLEGN